jgi:hypothetical protein
MGDVRNAYGVMVGNQKGKRPLGRPTRRWDDNFKIYLSKIGWGGIDWTHLDQDRNQRRVLVKTIMNLRVP